MHRFMWIVALCWVFLGTTLAQCHVEGDVEYCVNGSATATATRTKKPDCHNIGDELVCFGTAGPTTTIATLWDTPPTPTTMTILTIPDAEDARGMETPRPTPMTTKIDKAPYTPAPNIPKEKKPTACKPKKGQTWNLKLRIASIFIVFSTSTLGVLCPVFLSRYTKLKNGGYVFTMIQQTGTGVIISTVFIHLLEAAFLEFESPCVDEWIVYEPTPMAVALGGIFFAFLVDYCGVRILAYQAAKTQREIDINSSPALSQQDENISPISIGPKDNFARYDAAQARIKRCLMEEKKIGVYIMEGGIIFHSIMVGVLLTITPDSELVKIFAVVLVHQLFEGLALGARIEPLEGVRASTKIIMGLSFSVTCPVGMSIGIGVRKSFNGNDKNTIIILGFMNALSAGVLAWVAFVELWSKDWLHGELRTANAKKTCVAMISLMSGLTLMGVLGKWA